MANNKNSVPITRINKWFSAEDYALEVSMSRESIEGDGNFTLILYRVDREMSEYDSVYGEATKDGIKFFPPVELKVLPILAAPKNETYNKNGSLRYIQDGNLTFGVFEAHLDELEVTISYGDYVGYPVNEKEVRYFSVVNDGSKNYDNRHTIMGYRSAFRTIECAPVDATEFSSK